VKFGPVTLDAAENAVLAHSVASGKLRLKKGTVLGTAEIERLREAGMTQVIAAILEKDDVPEDEAASRIAALLDRSGMRAGPATTGRVNLFARWNGLFRVDRAIVDRFNRVDPAITLATLDDHAQVLAGEMVATVKIIPLAVESTRLEQAVTVLENTIAMEVKSFRPAEVALIATELPSLKPSVMDKTARLLKQRLAASGSRLVSEIRVAHATEDVAEAIGRVIDSCDLVILFGASAVVDSMDVLPAAIVLAGGFVDRVGMPVDPGNLLVLGHIGNTAIIGAPGCARSPKENGFDWILARILAGQTPSSQEIADLGVGGLLMEIPSRPSPRLSGETPGVVKPDVEAVILAAGRASRMGSTGQNDGGMPHKLLAEFDGVPLVRKTVETVLSADISHVHVVTGYRSADIQRALNGLDIEVVSNPDYEEGMASSLRLGISATGEDCSGVFVILADMPFISPRHLNTMLDAFAEHDGFAIVRAASGAKRGNPILLPRSTFAAISQLEGDIGARSIIEESGLAVIDIDIGDAALIDVDTKEAVIAAGGVLKE
jgi:molybdenum cofactor cytidylyltransferase